MWFLALWFVIPAKAGIQCLGTGRRKSLDPGFRRDDELEQPDLRGRKRHGAAHQFDFNCHAGCTRDARKVG
ncbi:hypothetical protein GCM10009126_01320 [Rhodanobacter caeni]|uniref:Secreted protein n=1 Tax=Rhodanobacter caeni TaxID=657654 RepID=A0ABN0U5J3_9GAMM